jgi:hypothetical protein
MQWWSSRVHVLYGTSWIEDPKWAVGDGPYCTVPRASRARPYLRDRTPLTRSWGGDRQRGDRGELAVGWKSRP